MVIGDLTQGKLDELAALAEKAMPGPIGPSPAALTEFQWALDPDTIGSLIEAARLGVAWQAAEAALPEGWDWGLTMTADHQWCASAAPVTSSMVYRDGKYTIADTPAAALQALTAKLQEIPHG
jgi:hypothetical protein